MMNDSVTGIRLEGASCEVKVHLILTRQPLLDLDIEFAEICGLSRATVIRLMKSLKTWASKALRGNGTLSCPE